MDNTGLTQIVNGDTTLSNEEKQRVLAFLKDEKALLSLTGGGLGLLIGKFLKLSKPAQVLITLAGFGISRVLVKHLESQPNPEKKFTNYDKKTRTYEIRP